MTNRSLGFLLAGLGLGELLRPRRITGALGVEGREAIVQAYGWRELAAGAALLAAPASPVPVWARVAGDVLDLGTIATALRERGAKTGPLLGALAFVGGALLLDIWAARRMERGRALHR